MGEWENGRMGEWENGRVGEWEGGLAIAVIPAAFAAIAITSRLDRSIDPCSQSKSTQSNPSAAIISTN
jgi:hypothetical protein